MEIENKQLKIINDALQVYKVKLNPVWEYETIDEINLIEISLKHQIEQDKTNE